MKLLVSGDRIWQQQLCYTIEGTESGRRRRELSKPSQGVSAVSPQVVSTRPRVIDHVHCTHLKVVLVNTTSSHIHIK